ncbi:YktB family protein [Cohnella sp. 56]|uniref:YktB family protein n=1 Tax=Cohnella sp. 56 TaxID=3113722 RepID=UPI0030EAD44C
MSTPTNDALTGFIAQDFDAMTIPGLDNRMQAIIHQVRPKLEQLGRTLAPLLSDLCAEPMYPHVAKHARRSVNPPDDTWVAWSRHPRGYKAHPHFQIGLWSTHLFIQFAIIYESANKSVFADRAAAELASIRASLPADYVWSKDHTLPEGIPHGELTDGQLTDWLARLKTVKAAEITCGVHIGRDDDRVRDPASLLRTAEAAFRTLLPLYKLSF